MAAIVINIAGSYDDKAIGQAQKRLNDLNGSAAAASAGMAGAFTRAGDKLKSIGSSISSAGQTMVRGVTLPIVGVGIAAAVAFDKVDEGLDTVAAKSGFTGDKLKGLEVTFKNVAGNATQSMEEIGESVGLLAGKLNLTGAPLEQLSTQVLDFARVTKTDAATAADTVATAMQAFGLSASEAGPLLDSLVAASQRSGISVSELGSQLATVAPQFQTYGLSVDESIGLLTAFGKSGIPATKMATGLNTAFKNLREQGVKDLPQGLRDVFEQIKNAENPTKATRIAVETFGSRVGITLAEAIRSGKVSLADLDKGLKGTKGALDDAVKATDGPQEQFARLKNQAMLLGAQFAELALPIVQKLIPAVQSVIDWFRSLSPQTQELIVKIAAIAAVVGPVLVVLGSLVTALGAIFGAIGFIIGSPVVLTIIGIVAAIAALAAAAKYAWENFEGFRNIVTGVWEAIQAAVGYVVDWFKTYVGPIISDVLSWITDDTSGLRRFFDDAFNGIWEIAQKVAAWFMENMWPTLDKVFQLIGQSLPILWSAFKVYWTNIFNAVRTIIEWFMQYVWPTLSTVFGYIGTALGVLWDAYKTYWTFIWELLQSVISWISNTLWPAIQTAWNNLKTAVTTLYNVYKANWDLILGVIRTVLDWIQNTLRPNISAAFDAIKGFVQGLWDKFTEAFNAIKGVVQTNIDAVLGILRGIGGIVSTVVEFFNSIRQGIVDKFTAAVEFVRGIPGKILEALGNVAMTLWQAGSDLIGGLIEGIKARAGEVLSTIQSWITDRIPQFVKDRLGISSPSTVMMEIGQWIPEGLARGIEKAARRAKEAARKLAEATTEEARNAAKDALKAAEDAARDLARRTAQVVRDSATAGLDRVKEKAREVMDYVRGVKDDMRSFGSVMRTTFDKGTLSASQIVTQMKDRLRVATNFAMAVATLRDLGLNNRSLQDIIKAGPDAGLEIAQALASEGPLAIAEVNALENMLGRIGGYVGDVGAQSELGMNSTRAQGIIDTSVNVQAGAIVLNFGAGTTAQDQDAIRRAVEQAVQEGLRELAREINAS